MPTRNAPLLPGSELQGVKTTPAWWSFLLLIFALLIAYPVLDHLLLSHMSRGLLERQHDSQRIAASALMTLVALSVERGEDPITAFQAAEAIQPFGTAGSQLSAALVAADGTLLAAFEGFGVTSQGNLGSHQVTTWPIDDDVSFIQFIRGSSRSGELTRPTGAKLDMLVSCAKLPTIDDYIVTFQDTSAVQQSLATARLYLLLAFLALSTFMLLLILSFYFSLAAGLSSAVNSAIALEQASLRFKERAGAMRRPLHNIQGLADMLSITDDPDERNNYLQEIKGEVSRIIKDLEQSSG